MAAIFTTGDVVRLDGLVSNWALNGAVGTIVGDIDKSRERYTVHIQNPAAAVAAHPSGISLNPLNLIKVVQCAKPGCDKVGTQGCSACVKEYYCTAECQKSDWKTHKLICRLIKLMPDSRVPFKEVFGTVQEIVNDTSREICEARIAKLGMERYIKLLYHTEKFAEKQFGKKIAGTDSYMRENGFGDRIMNWNCEIDCLLKIYTLLAQYNFSNDMLAIYYYQKALALLEPWRVQIGLYERDRIDKVLTQEVIYDLFSKLSGLEFNLSVTMGHILDWARSKHHIEKSIMHSKKMKDGKEKVEQLYKSFSSLANTYYTMNNLTESKAYREEAYMCVSEMYNPEHPLVLEAGGHLITILGRTGDFYDAERFARICYEGLTRHPLNPDSCEAAKAAGDLSEASINMIEAKGPESADIIEAEMLARKAVRIMKELKGCGSLEFLNAFNSLSKVIMLKKDFSDESKSLLEENLSDSIRCQGIDGRNTGHANSHLGFFYMKFSITLSCNDARRHLELSEPYMCETVRIFIINYGKDHLNTLQARKNLSLVYRLLVATESSLIGETLIVG
jgi:tetratricopeptide (TPR) repeat protein